MKEKKTVKHQLLDLYEEVIQEYVDSNPPKKIKAILEKEVDRQRVNILRTLLGLEHRYTNKWTVDHCNGRSGESAIGDYLRNVQAKEIHKIFDSMDMSDVITKTIEKDIRLEYQINLKKGLISLVRKKAKEDAENIIKTVQEEFNVKDLLDTQEILNELVNS
mgnify:CR=1 FL=1